MSSVVCIAFLRTIISHFQLEPTGQSSLPNSDFLGLEKLFLCDRYANGCSRASDRTIHIRIPIFLQLWHVSTQSYEATSTYLAYSQEEETHIVLLVKLPVYQSSQYWYNFAILLCRLWKKFCLVTHYGFFHFWKAKFVQVEINLW